MKTVSKFALAAIVTLSASTFVEARSASSELDLDPETLRLIEEEAKRQKLGKTDVRPVPTEKKVNPDDLLPSERRDLAAKEAKKSTSERASQDRTTLPHSGINPSRRDDKFRVGRARPGDAFKSSPSRSLGQSGSPLDSRRRGLSGFGK